MSQLITSLGTGTNGTMHLNWIVDTHKGRFITLAVIVPAVDTSLHGMLLPERPGRNHLEVFCG